MPFYSVSTLNCGSWKTWSAAWPLGSKLTGNMQLVSTLGVQASFGSIQSFCNLKLKDYKKIVKNRESLFTFKLTSAESPSFWQNFFWQFWNWNFVFCLLSFQLWIHLCFSHRNLMLKYSVVHMWQKPGVCLLKKRTECRRMSRRVQTVWQQPFWKSWIAFIR